MKKKILITLGSILSTLVLIVLGYVIYISCQYYRIEDNKNYFDKVENNQSQIVTTNTKYSITTYNIGFGAYNHEFSFFMDSGTMLDGKKVTGKDSKAASKDVVLTNTDGAIETINNLNPDFALFQEVDTNSTRSFKVNQYDKIKEKLLNMASVHISNFHSAYLFYPIFDNHGIANSGIATFSKYQISDVVRKSLEITNAFPTKFFDLDRCFSATYVKTNNNKYLVIINAHLSAYDEGGIYRQKQLKQLNDFMQSEYDKGNYVVCGGDFNHDIADSLNTFETKQNVPEWVYVLTNNDLNDKFMLAASKNVPTCRSTDIPYVKGTNYSVVLDGFIISDNIELVTITNIDTDFVYSDHNPAYMEFILK